MVYGVESLVPATFEQSTEIFTVDLDRQVVRSLDIDVGYVVVPNITGYIPSSTKQHKLYWLQRQTTQGIFLAAPNNTGYIRCRTKYHPTYCAAFHPAARLSPRVPPRMGSSTTAVQCGSHVLVWGGAERNGTCGGGDPNCFGGHGSC